MDALWAEEVLRERGNSLTADEVERLTLLATGSKKAAEDAWSKALAAQMRAGDMRG